MKTKRERGAALVELAMILPLLAVLFMGIVDFGLVQREHQILQNAVREGARVSMLPNYNAKMAMPVNGEDKGQASQRVATVIRDVVRTYLQNENIIVAAVDCADSDGNRTHYVCGDVEIDQGMTLSAADGVELGISKVTVTVKRDALLKFYGPFTLTGSSVFRNLY